MTLEQARQLRPGQVVTCPSDMGQAGYKGTVHHVSEVLAVHRLVPNGFLWVTVKGPGGTCHVWPSNRLK